MNHTVITIIKWTFLVIGIALLAGATAVRGEGTLILSILGLEKKCQGQALHLTLSLTVVHGLKAKSECLAAHTWTAIA